VVWIMPANDALIEALEKAVAVAPDNAALRKHLADLLMADGRLEAAVQHYRQALNHAPADQELKLALAEAYQRLEKPDVSLVIVEEILRGASPLPRALLLAARLYLSNGSLREAAQAYHQALVGDPALEDPVLENALAETPLKAHPAEKSDAREPLLLVSTQETADTGIEIERPRITFQDVGGMDKVKEEIKMKIIYPMAQPELFRAYGKKIGGGILMYGPPGCGKTYLARATAGEVKASFISIGLHDVLDMYIGQSEQNLHRIFEAARRQAPCVLFFDEVDALGASRSDMRHNAMRQVINQFLAELDGVDSSNEGVLILAATNTPWYVDVALRRPGRFDRVLFVPPPDLPAREAILRIHLAGKPLDRIDYARLAREMRDFSGADIKGMVEHVVERKLQEAMRQGAPAPLTTNDLLAGFKETRPTTREWFDTARNYAVYANEGGLYDEILTYLKITKGGFSS
jgi:transitional endoplasmic reticulum ATPase